MLIGKFDSIMFARVRLLVLDVVREFGRDIIASAIRAKIRVVEKGTRDKKLRYWQLGWKYARRNWT